MKNLTEGLQENDLKDLVLPLVSIDEFESKIADDAIVLGFYVLDSEPARDLERFIQKSAFNILDTEVSPAPDENGYFLLFVEVLRDRGDIMKVLDLVESFKGLTALELSNWKFSVYGHEGVYPLEQKQLEVLVNFDDEEISDEDSEEEELEDLDDLNEFFQPSLLDGFHKDGNTLVLERFGRTLNLEILDFGTIILAEKHGLVGKPLHMHGDARMNERKLENMLGENWGVSTVDNVIMLSNTISPKVLFVRMS